MKIITLLCLSVLAGSGLYAQSDLPAPVVYNDSIRLVPVLKFAPLFLLDPAPTLQFALETPLSIRMAVQQEFGIGRKSKEAYQFANASVFRSRTEFRYYLTNNRGQLRSYKRTGSFDERRGRFEAILAGPYVSGELLYRSLTTNSRSRNTYALHGKFGVQMVSSQSTVFDVYAGVGWRWIIDKRSYSFNSPSRDGFDILSTSLGFKIGLSL